MSFYNVKVKEYGEAGTVVTHYSKPVKYMTEEERENELKRRETKEKIDAINKELQLDEEGDQKVVLKNERSQEQINHSLQTSVNRSKVAIYDLAKSNEWEYFVTFTFDQLLYDSTNYDVCWGLMRKFRDNIRTNYAPNIRYLFVPEFHSDGIHFHFHGLIANIGSLKLIPWKPDKDGNQIYIIEQWKYGRNDCTAIKDARRVSSYITKYITKDLADITKGKNRYLASKNLKKPIVTTYNSDTFLEDSVEKLQPDYIATVEVPEAGNVISHLYCDTANLYVNDLYENNKK